MAVSMILKGDTRLISIATSTALADCQWLEGSELGAVLRREGLHGTVVDEWRRHVEEGALAALGGKRQRTREQKRIRELERELKRKDKALAETAALLVLTKKVQALWGDGDDDTPGRNER